MWFLNMKSSESHNYTPVCGRLRRLVIEQVYFYF